MVIISSLLLGKNFQCNCWLTWAGSPGLVVMGGGSCSKVHEFESRHRILDGHFFTYLSVVKFRMCFWKGGNKWKRGWGWPFLKNVDTQKPNCQVSRFARVDSFLHLISLFPPVWPEKILPHVYKSCPKMISIEKW